MSGLNLTEMSGVTLVKLGLLSVDTEIPEDDSKWILRQVAREADRRGWPDGWYEDPSVLSAEQLGLPPGPRLAWPLTDKEKAALEAIEFPTLARVLGVDRQGNSCPACAGTGNVMVPEEPLCFDSGPVYEPCSTCGDEPEEPEE